MSLAHHLGIRNRTLLGTVIRRDELYETFTIPKKSGGVRLIHAPQPRLKFVQTRVLERFLTPLACPEHIAAYVPGRATRYSAEKHCGKKVVIVIDLQDFFTSTRRAWVRRMLHRELHLPFEVASLLAEIMTVGILTSKGRRYVVPQGAPTSGAICNWVAHYRLDVPLLELCRTWEMTYTRYADDLAFSCDKPLEKTEVNRFIRAVSKLIVNAGYTVNRKKLRVTRPGRQQRLLGMTVNEKPNVMRAQYRAIRARIHHCHHKGFDAVAKEMKLESGQKLLSQLEGKISYYHMINPDKAALLKKQLEAAQAHHAEVLHSLPDDSRLPGNE
jgi:hypothetical protein